MTHTQILEQARCWAEEAGATHARLAGRELFIVKEPVRMACLANACGRSGRNWTCPPHVGELDACGEFLRGFPGGVLVQNIATLEDSWDFEGMADACVAHNRMLRELAGKVAAAYPAAMVARLGAGGCDFCERCACPDEPCRFPAESMSSVESFGLDIREMVEACGLHYINGQNTVSYVGLLLVRTEEP